MTNRFQLLDDVGSDEEINDMLEQMEEESSRTFMNGIGGRMFVPYQIDGDNIGCPCCEDDPNDDYPELQVYCSKDVYLQDDIELLAKTISYRDKLCKVTIHIDRRGQEKPEVRLKFVDTIKYPNDCDKSHGVKEKKITWSDNLKKAVEKMFTLTVSGEIEIVEP